MGRDQKIEVRNSQTGAKIMIHHPGNGKLVRRGGQWVYSDSSHLSIPVSNGDAKRIKKAKMTH